MSHALALKSSQVRSADGGPTALAIQQQGIVSEASAGRHQSGQGPWHHDPSSNINAGLCCKVLKPTSGPIIKGFHNRCASDERHAESTLKAGSALENFEELTPLKVRADRKSVLLS